MSEMLSVGVLARRFGVSVSRVRYAAQSRGIKPVSVAGRIHIYDEATAARIGAALVRCQTRKLDLEAAAPSQG